MITDNNGTPISHIANALAVSLPEEHPATPPKQKRRDYKPAPGRVTVLRDVTDKYYVRDEELDIVKSPMQIQYEESFAIFATVARVGDQLPGGPAPFFQKGDVVSILPSMADRIEIAPGFSVWCLPFSAVTGKFEEVMDAAAETNF